MAARLTGKVAVVTGAGSGIGRAIALGFAEEGARVAFMDIDGAAARAAAASVAGGLAVVVDVADEDSVAQAFAAVARDLGVVDVVVACAAIELFGGDGAVHELRLEAWQATMNVNLTGVFLTGKYAVRAMLGAGRQGSIINIGSPTGRRGSGLGQHAYSASKGGVHALSQVMAMEYAAVGIRVNTLIPGATRTPLTERALDDPTFAATLLSTIPMGRIAAAEDYVGIAVYLASDESTYATGAMFVVDGGLGTR